MNVIEIYRYQRDLEGEDFSPYEWRVSSPQKSVTLNGFRVDQRAYALPDNWYLQRGCVSKVGSLVEQLNAGQLEFKDLPKELFN